MRRAFVLVVGGTVLAGCGSSYHTTYPKVAGAVAGAAAGIAIAQAVAAAHSNDTAVGSAGAPSDELSPVRDAVLRALNNARAEAGAPALAPSAPLNEFAQRGSEALSDDHVAHGHVKNDARGAGCGESQSGADGEAAGSPEEQVRAAMKRMLSDATDRATLLAPKWRFVGVGAVRPDGRMFLTIDLTETSL